MTRRLLPHLPALLMLLLAPCLLLWRVVFSGDVFLPADLLKDIAPWAKPAAPPPIPWNPLMWDGLAEFYPWRLLYSQSLHQGILPLLNPYQGGGLPLLANSQSAVFYPFNLLFVLFPVKTAFGVSVLLHLFGTGAGMYAFLCFGQLRLSRAAALTGALCWQLSAWQVAWLALPTFLCASAWLPLAFLCVDKTAARPTALRASTLGIVCGLMVLGGHLQVALYCLLSVGAWGVFCAVRAVRQQKISVVHLLTATAFAVCILVGLSLPQTLPAAELSRVSHRAGGHPTLDGYAGYVRLAVPAINLVTLWTPGFYGSPTLGTYWGIGLNGGPGAFMENAASVGAWALLLVLAGLMGTWKTLPTTRFFAYLALVALLLAFGTPLNGLLYFGLPGFSQSGSPGRVLVVWTFCASVLCGAGAHALLMWPSPLRLLGRAGVVWAVLFGAAFGLAAWWVGRNAPAGALSVNLASVGDWWRAPLGITLAGVCVWGLRMRGSLSVRAAGAAMALLVGTEALASGIGFNRTCRAADVFPITPTLAFLMQHKDEGRIMPVNTRWSLDGAHPPRAVLPPNTATVYGLYDVQGYDSLLPGHYFQWAGQLNNGSPAPPENGNMIFTHEISSPLARDAGVKYVFVREQFAIGLSAVLDDGDTAVYTAGTGGNVKPFALAADWYPGWQRGKDGTRIYMPTSLRIGLYGLCLTMFALSALTASAGIGQLRGRWSGGREIG